MGCSPHRATVVRSYTLVTRERAESLRAGGSVKLAKVAMGLSVALACAASPGFAQCTDADGDGYPLQAGCGSAQDCDDRHSAIHPGAAEVCNWRDDDCD